jgi:hypothetical protein
MSMPDVMEVVLDQTYAGQQIINRWNYLANGTPAAVSFSFALTSALGAIFDEVAVPPGYPPTGLMQLIAAIQNTGVTFNSLTVKNVYSVTDFYSTLFVNSLVGARTGEGNSPAVAFGFFTNRVRSDIRRATKRFTGVSEGESGALGVIVAGASTMLTTLADAMSDVLEYDDEGNNLTFTPCVVSKQRYNSDTQLADAEGNAYRYYPTESEQLEHVADSIFWDWYPQVRTQTSRQYGKGR